MTSDRRSFLRLAGAISAATAGGGATAVAAAAVLPSGLTRSVFAREIGEDFVFEKHAVSETIARLTKVEPLPTATTNRESEHRFRAVFKVQSPGGLEQLTYRVRHPRMGEFVMFVSPKSAQGDIVEAVFNRV
ncbi:MAG TPA: hypothetical protein VH040_08160 [Usitatibacter sp.]|jgi:anti-sigma factor RsiW|nr:hypothetical protein [Usitatibacter sp.]